LARKRELETQRLRQELTHIGRVSAMGELAASLAHELNQPLTAILSNAQAAQRFLAADGVDLAQIREILSDIVADDKRAGDVIRRLRVLFKKSDPEYASLALNKVVGEVARLVRNDAVLRNVTMRLELAPNLPRVRGDRVQLQQVVLNLVLNGFEAVGEPGVTERARHPDGIREGAGRRPGRGARLRGWRRREGRGPHVPRAYTTKVEGLAWA
jgi:two-component system sensor kinase FixL